MQPIFFCSFIGSRKLAEIQYVEQARHFYIIAYRCAELGIGIRSGGASGSDFIAEQAYADAIKDGKASIEQVEIFVPWKPFQAVRGQNNPLHHLHILPTDPALIKQAEQMVRQIHPAPNRLSQGAMKLHSRNMNQVFGLDLKSPIKGNVCWTEGGITSGGTRSAIELCERNGIPVFNFGGDRELVTRDFRQFLLDNKVPGVR